jgi:hypothetical protein
MAITAEYFNKMLQGHAGALSAGIDPSTEAPYDISTLLGLNPIPVVPVTPTKSVIVFVPTPYAGPKLSIRWLGYPENGNLGGITSFWICVYKYIGSSGRLDRVHLSGNIQNQLAGGSGPTWNSYNLLPTGTTIETEQDDIYAIEFCTGAGSVNYNVIGFTGNLNQIPPLDDVFPERFGGERVWAQGLGNPTYIQELKPPPYVPTIYDYEFTAASPWAGLCGKTGRMTYPPVLLVYDKVGTDSYQNPTQRFPWANWFDIVTFGAGGGGWNGGVWLGGLGGYPGHASGRTLSKVNMGTKNLTITVGQGNPLATGQTTSVTVPDYSTYEGWGGSPGPGLRGLGGWAEPGHPRQNLEYQDVYGIKWPYFGGGGGGSGQLAGQQPSGGGAGGNSSSVLAGMVYGGAGGAGAVFILCYQ